MDQYSKNGSRPTPDAALSTKHLAFKLEETLAAENLLKLDLLCIDGDRKPWEVAIESRDGAVHILRFLRIWFDLPSTVFFKAVSYMDQFLVRIKVQEKFVKCLTVSCFFVAAAQEGYNINANQLVNVSQSKCSVKDMLRMADIVKKKLKLDNAQEQQTTAADFLNVFIDILEFLTCISNVEFFLKNMIQRERLLTRLEVLMTDHECAFYRPSILALVLVRMEIEKEMTRGITEKSVYFLQELVNVFAVIAEIQYTCQITNPDLANCYNSSMLLLEEYDNQNKARHSQNLLWRFSSTTHALCNKHRNFHFHLKPIKEQHYQ